MAARQPWAGPAAVPGRSGRQPQRSPQLLCPLRRLGRRADCARASRRMSSARPRRAARRLRSSSLLSTGQRSRHPRGPRCGMAMQLRRRGQTAATCRASVVPLHSRAAAELRTPRRACRLTGSWARLQLPPSTGSEREARRAAGRSRQPMRSRHQRSGSAAARCQRRRPRQRRRRLGENRLVGKVHNFSSAARRS